MVKLSQKTAFEIGPNWMTNMTFNITQSKNLVSQPSRPAPHKNGNQASTTDEVLVTRINAEELKKAVESPTALLELLHRHQAPRAILRVKDDEPRKMHANVRGALEAINAAPDGDALISALCVASGLPKQSTLADLLLYLLGSYDLRKGPDGKVIDAFFWARDRGVQTYLEEKGVPSSKTASTLKDLGGVDATYRLWVAEKKGSPQTGRSQSSLQKAALEKVPGIKVGERIFIEAELSKPGKLKFIGIHKCIPLGEGEIVADTCPSAPRAPAGLIEAH